MKLEHVLEVLRERVTVAVAHRDKTKGICVALSDPEAGVQPDKTGRYVPSYKPVIAVEKYLLIMGQHVEVLSEQASVEPALAQRTALMKAPAACMVGDSAFCNLENLKQMEAHSENVLCATRSSHKERSRLPMKHGKFDKQAFRFDVESQTLTCPVGRDMAVRQQAKEAGQKVVIYQGQGCGECREKVRCTTSSTGRIVKLYEVDERKRKMEEKLEHREMALLYGLRKQTVELVWAVLKGTLRCVRFHRRGLKAIRAEFALWCLTYNVWRTLHLLAPRH